MSFNPFPGYLFTELRLWIQDILQGTEGMQSVHDKVGLLLTAGRHRYSSLEMSWLSWRSFDSLLAGEKKKTTNNKINFLELCIRGSKAAEAAVSRSRGLQAPWECFEPKNLQFSTCFVVTSGEQLRQLQGETAANISKDLLYTIIFQVKK